MTIQSGAAAAATELAARLSPDRVLTPAACYDQVTALPARDHCLAPERVEAPLGAAGRYGAGEPARLGRREVQQASL